VVVELNSTIILFDFKLESNKDILDASVETTIHGPQKALSENLE
jgi:hypothetical protein